MTSILTDNQRELIEIAEMLWNNGIHFYTNANNHSVSITVSENQKDFDYYNLLTINERLHIAPIEDLEEALEEMDDLLNKNELINIYVDVKEILEKTIDYRKNISKLYTVEPAELYIFWLNELLDDYDDLTLHKDTIRYLLFRVNLNPCKAIMDMYKESMFSKLPLTFLK